MKADFTKGIERIQVETVCLGYSERRGLSLVFVWDLGGFMEDCGLVLLGIQERLRTKARANCYSLEPVSLGVQVLALVVWDRHMVAKVSGAGGLG